MKKIFLILVMVLLSSFVLAIPPFTQGEGLDGEIQISAPKLLAVEINNEFNPHFHVMNSSGHLLDNTTTVCLLHVYNNTGDHILEENLSFDGVDFEIMVPFGTLNQIGIHSFILNCESDSEAGFFSTNFEVTRTGVPSDHANSSLKSVSVFFFVLISFFVSLFFIFKNHIRWGFFLLAFIMLDAFTYLAWQTTVNNSLTLSIVQPMYILYYVSLTLTLVMFLFVLVIFTSGLQIDNFKKDNFKDNFDENG